MKTCTVQELRRALKAGGDKVYFVDCRTSEDFRDEHIAGTINISYGSTLEDMSEYKESTIYVICHSGGRSLAFCGQLLDSDIDIINVEGGLMAWKMAGLPMERG